MSTTTNMGLELPVIDGTDVAPSAQLVLDAFETIDTHDHSASNGVKITPAGMNVNAELDVQGNPITNLDYINYDEQVSALSGASLASSSYFFGGEFYVIDGNGTAVQVTDGGSVNIAGNGGWIGDYSSDGDAGAGFVSATDTFYLKQNTATNQAGVLDTGDIKLRDTVAGTTKFVTIKSPSLSVGWTMTLPVAPAANSVLACDASGNITADPTVSVSSVTTAGGVACGHNMTVGNDLTVTGDITGAAVNSTDLNVTGPCDVTGITNLGSTLSVSSNTTVGGTLGVTGASTLTGAVSTGTDLSVGGDLVTVGSVTSSTTITSTGDLTVGGLIDCNGVGTNALTGALTVGGAASVGNTFTASSTANINGTLNALSTFNAQGTANFNSDLNVNSPATVDFKAGTTTTFNGTVNLGDYTYTERTEMVPLVSAPMFDYLGNLIFWRNAANDVFYVVSTNSTGGIQDIVVDLPVREGTTITDFQLNYKQDASDYLVVTLYKVDTNTGATPSKTSVATVNCSTGSSWTVASPGSFSSVVAADERYFFEIAWNTGSGAAASNGLVGSLSYTYKKD